MSKIKRLSYEKKVYACELYEHIYDFELLNWYNIVVIKKN